MKAVKFITGLLTILVMTPIWYFLLYTLLQAAHVDRLVWFLFWVYLPLGFVVQVLGQIAERFLKGD